MNVHTITLSALDLDIPYSVKDNSPRGCHTESGHNLKIGDKIVIDNYFTEIIPEPAETATEPAETAEAPKTTDSTPNTESPAEAEEAPTTSADNFARIRSALEASPARSAWARGVKEYAAELLEGLEEATLGGWFDLDDLASPKLVSRALLNGASDWEQYSWGGSALIYDEDIARRLCSPSELKRTHDGERRPNACEEWLDTQARALFQASALLRRIIREEVSA